MSIFSKFIKMTAIFGKKLAGEINQIDGKVIHTIQKGTRIGGKVLDIAIKLQESQKIYQF